MSIFLLKSLKLVGTDISFVHLAKKCLLGINTTYFGNHMSWNVGLCFKGSVLHAAISWQTFL